MGLLTSHPAVSATEKRTGIYLTASYFGAGGILLCLTARLLHWPDFVQGFSIGLLLVSLLILLLGRGGLDEYYRSLWEAGTSAAFAVLVLWFLFAPLAQRIVEGGENSALYRDMPSGWGAPLAILGFFIGFHAARWRNR